MTKVFGQIVYRDTPIAVSENSQPSFKYEKADRTYPAMVDMLKHFGVDLSEMVPESPLIFHQNTWIQIKTEFGYMVFTMKGALTEVRLRDEGDRLVFETDYCQDFPPDSNLFGSDWSYNKTTKVERCENEYGLVFERTYRDGF